MADAHDKAFGATIERALKGETGAGECPDIGIVAAYVERALTAAETSAFEAHAARCAACQAVMAAMVRAEDSASFVSAHRRVWRNWRFLFAPVLAAAAAVAFVIALRLAPPGRNNQPMQQAGHAPMSRRVAEAPRAAMAVPAAPAVPVPPAAMSAAKRRQSLVAESPAIRSEAAGARSDKSRPPPVRFLPKSEVASARPHRAARPRVAAAARARPELAAPIVVSSPDGRMMWRIGPGSQIARAEIPSPQSAAQTPIPQARGIVAQRMAVPSAVTGSAVGQAAGALASSSALAPQARSRFERLQTKPSWRELNSGVEPGLLAASSPANDVCWVVGRDGTVIITVDGIHWHRIRSPVRADLTAVRATSLFAAEVVTADGRRFATTDGGNTWKAVPVR